MLTTGTYISKPKSAPYIHVYTYHKGYLGLVTLEYFSSFLHKIMFYVNHIVSNRVAETIITDIHTIQSYAEVFVS